MENVTSAYAQDTGFSDLEESVINTYMEANSDTNMSLLFVSDIKCFL
jgi:hypothetical protein